MKKSLLALAALAFVASAAHAQSNVTVYGAIDIGISKTKDTTTKIGRGDNNKLGFKGVEDLGGGLSAVFQLEMRYEPDTGTTESFNSAIPGNSRPLFQGQTRVGLKGDFGQIRLGRGLTAMQESAGAYEPWSFDANRATLTSYSVAGYNSDPQNSGSSTNRFSNAVFYNTPVFGGGFQANFTLASKEAVTNGTPVVNAYSFSGTYNNGPLSAMLGYERNGLETKFWNLAASYMIAPGMKLMGSYADQKISRNLTTPFASLPAGVSVKTDAYVLGGNFTVGQGVILAGYGHSKTSTLGTDTTSRQFSLGYEYNLSKRTFLYADVLQSRVSPPSPFPSVSSHTFDVGVHHNF